MDDKDTENVDADLLSRVTTDSTSDITLIDDYFPDESLLSLSSMPWFAKNINFLATGDLPAHWSTEDIGKFLNEVKNFYWDDLNLFKYCPDQIFQRCIPDNEVSSVIKLCHSEACGNHFSSQKTVAKIFQNGFHRRHQSFGHVKYAPPYVPPPRRNLEETLHAFIEKQETINTQLAQTMTDFKDTLAKFT
jgi:hypothetical protein